MVAPNVYPNQVGDHYRFHLDDDQLSLDLGANVSQHSLKVVPILMTKIPYNFQDYDIDEQLEFRKNRLKFWEILKQLRNEYSAVNHNFDIDGFVKYVGDIYGIKLFLNNTGITDYYEVVDSVKYLMFKLKFE